MNFFLVIPAKASSGGFVPDILPILTVNKTQETRLKTKDMFIDEGITYIDDLWQPQASPKESGPTWERLMN